MFARKNGHRKIFLLLPLILLLGAGAAFAQGTSFTFQGKLGDSGSPVSGSFDMQFKLFAAETCPQAPCTPIVTPITFDGTNGNPPLVTVTNGVFTVQLNFGSAALPGADRFLEIGVRRNSAEPYAVLSPRSKITSSPYAIRSLNATNATKADGMSTNCVGCIQSSHINSVDASKLTGTLPASAIAASSLPAGSGNYIQNATSPQTANFNVSGNGVVGTLNVGGIASGPMLNVTGRGLVRASINATSTTPRAADANGGLSLTLNDQPSWSLASVGNTGNFQIFNDATGQNAVLIDRTNKVGIGTTTPAQKLSVAGTIESTSGGVKFPDGTVQDGAVGPTYTTASNNTAVEFSQTNTAERAMLHLTVPNGAYLVESTLEIDNANSGFGSNNRTVRCRFTGETSTLYNADLDAEHRSFLTLHSIVTVSTGGIDVLCGAFPNGNFVGALTRRMTAIRLGGTISVQ